MRYCAINYQIEVAVEAAAESPRLITFTAEVDKSHAWEAWLDAFQSVCKDVHGIIDERRLRLCTDTNVHNSQLTLAYDATALY